MPQAIIDLVKFSAVSVSSMLLLSACNDSDRTEAPTKDEEVRQKLIGTWRADTRLPGDIYVQSATIRDSDGRYIWHLTNTLSDEVRIYTEAGTFRVKEGMLIHTITNNYGRTSLVPRLGLEGRIVRIDERELVLHNSKHDDTVIYRKDK